MSNKIKKGTCFIPFPQQVKKEELPGLFTFPFYYEPHSLSVIASEHLQEYLSTQTEWEHNFGLNVNQKGLIIGKMFGVLVVEDHTGEIGYLAAFSGKLANENHHSRFVPPVFDMLKKDGFYKKGEEELNGINSEIERLETDSDYRVLLKELEKIKAQVAEEIEAKKKETREAKKVRKERREKGRLELNELEFKVLEEELKKESLGRSYHLKMVIKTCEKRVEDFSVKVSDYQIKIDSLKEERKKKSNLLQQRLFDNYTFLNSKLETKNLQDIFSFSDQFPPAGSGECAAPKLLQYAYLNNLRPIAMAEFWWGQSPNSEIRKHKNYYPACRGKCEPILGHMLQGLSVEENPMEKEQKEIKEIPVVYEDEYLAVINKPSEFLSVPGKKVQDSVATRMKKKYPNATGPLIVHRLDMSTSGLILIAKSMDVHKELQRQFIKRTIKKRYIALLEGEIKEEEGIIDLPLRVDLEDRPRQLVCYEHGKPAQTKWKVIHREKNRTRVHFFPITGRTHQLRVHAAHVKGLNTPIVGDDLYGVLDRRLHLHAEVLEFTHPISNESMKISVEADF